MKNEISLARILLATACPGSPALWAVSFTFSEIIKIGKKRRVWHGIGENTLKVREEIPLGFVGR